MLSVITLWGRGRGESWTMLGGKVQKKKGNPGRGVFL